MDYRVLVERLEYYGTAYATEDDDGAGKTMLDAAAVLETMLAEREESREIMRGSCSVCKHKPSRYAERLDGKPVAYGKCATCKYSGREMFLLPNSIQQNEDNWEWIGASSKEEETQ